MQASGCAPQDSDTQNEACHTVEIDNPITISKIDKFTYQSEFDYDPVKGIQIVLDCEVDGFDEDLVDSCNGNPELVILGTAIIDKNGKYEQVQTSFGTHPITENGLQHINVSLDYPTVNIINFEIAITGPNGAPLLYQRAENPSRSQL